MFDQMNSLLEQRWIRHVWRPCNRTTQGTLSDCSVL